MDRGARKRLPSHVRARAAGLVALTPLLLLASASALPLALFQAPPVAPLGLGERSLWVVALLAALAALWAQARAQRSRSAERASFRRWLAAADLGTWEWEVATGRARRSAGWYRMLGYAPGDVDETYEAWFALVHPEDRARVGEAIDAHLRGETEQYRSEQRLRHRAGHYVWVLDSGRIVERDPSGAPLSAVGVQVNIAASVEAREALAVSKQAAEAALREVDALRTALDEHSLLSIADSAGRIIDVNTGFCTISGYSRAELLGNDHRILNSGVHPMGFWAGVWKQIRTGTAWRGEVCNRRKDGTLYWVDSTIVPCLDALGRVEKFVSIRFDITPRKLAEERLRTREQELEAIFRATPGVIYRCRIDEHWTMDWISDGILDLSGYPAADFVANGARSFASIIHPEDRQGVSDEVHLSLAQSREFDLHYRVLRRDGQTRWVHERGGGRTDPVTGHVVLIGFLVDTTEQTLAQERVRESEQRFRALFDGSRDALMTVDLRTGRFATANQAALDLFRVPDGRRFGELSPWDLSPTHQPDGQESARAAADVIGIAEREGSHFFEWMHRTFDGVDFPATVLLTRMEVGNEVFLHALVRDITLQKQSEQALLDARRAAEAASAAKSEFLANMSHEIRTPMTAILGYTELLAENGGRGIPAAEVLEYTQTIQRNGEHLLAILNDILDLSKIEAGRMTVEHIPTDPVQILQEVEDLMQVKAQGKGLALTTERLTPLPGRIQSDPVRLRQILMNLVGNAIKFTELGRVRLCAAYDPEAPGGGAVVFSVVDTGVGIDANKLPRLFEAFSQADTTTTRRFGGTGLGLRISRSLAEALGGSIDVASDPGRGSTFTLTVPCGESAHRGAPGLEPCGADRQVEGPAPALPMQGSGLLLSGARIFLAEDGRDNQRLIGLHLRRAGASVHVFDNGEACLAALTQSGDADGQLREPVPCDLVLTDMQMPRMDGYGLARALRSKGWTGPIVALTALAMEGDLERCTAAGCDGYATKPIDRATLVEVCARALGRTPARDGEPAQRA